MKKLLLMLVALSTVSFTGIDFAEADTLRALRRGSYLRTCVDAKVRDHVLYATCRNNRGGMNRTKLRLGQGNVSMHDILNIDGQLTPEYMPTSRSRQW